jgi:ribosomal protein S18 acetylase RimI-like enzyme
MPNSPLYAYSECAIAHRSPEFWQAVELRQRVLREPLGLTLSVAEVLLEGPPMEHYGLFEFLDAETPSRIFACASASPISPGIWKIRQVAVAPELQGYGYGAQLMHGIERHLTYEEPVTCYQLNSRQNVAGFYQKLGYEIVGAPFEEIGIPHVLMQKRVV